MAKHVGGNGGNVYFTTCEEKKKEQSRKKKSKSGKKKEDAVGLALDSGEDVTVFKCYIKRKTRKDGSSKEQMSGNTSR